MAKRKDIQQPEAEDTRRSRKEQLRERRAAQQSRQMRLVAAAVIGVIVVIALVAIVIEFFIVPGQVVASVKGEEITLAEWQEEVEFQRAQLILNIEEQYELFLGDDLPEDAAALEEAENNALRFVQQAAGQQILILGSVQGAESLGEFVLDQMVDDAIIRQAAAERGIEVTEAEIDAAVGEQYSYFDGGLPTPRPTGTATPMPTPSVTPIPFGDAAEEEEVVEEVPTEEGPEPTPFPTNTPVSEESFNEMLQEDLGAIDSEGADPELYRRSVESQLYREKLAEALYVEQERPTEGEHAAIQFITFEQEDTASEFAAMIENEDFLTVWNEVRSAPPPDPTAELDIEEAAARPRASEILWRTAEELENVFSPDVVEEIFALSQEEVSGVLESTNMADGTRSYVVVKLLGKEVRPLSEFTILRLQGELLQEWLEEQRLQNVELYENWRSRVPRQPVLDLRFRTPVDQAQQPVVPAGGQNN